MHTYIHTTHTYIHTYIHTYTHTYTHTHIIYPPTYIMKRQIKDIRNHPKMVILTTSKITRTRSFIARQKEKMDRADMSFSGGGDI